MVNYYHIWWIKMDRLKTLGTWILLVIAFYIFSQVMTYLFLHKAEPVEDNVVTNNVTNEANEHINNVPENRIEILN